MHLQEFGNFVVMGAAVIVTDFEQILTNTDACLVRQYEALLATENVKLDFRPDAIRRLGATIVAATYDECWRTVEAHGSPRMPGRFSIADADHQPLIEHHHYEPA